MPRRSILIVALTLCALALGLALATFVLRRNQDIGGTQSTASTASIGGPFTLVDHNGKTVTDQTYRGKWLLIYFGYTNCPDACPLVLTNIGVVLDKLGAGAGKLQPLFITVDPKRDTVKVMADYLKSFDPQIVGLTGSEAQTTSVVKAYRVYVESENKGDNYSVAHSSYYYIMDPQGRFVNVIAGDVAGEEIANRLRKAISS